MGTNASTCYARVLLPLLAHAEPAVYRQGGVLLLSMYGDQAVPALQHLATDRDSMIRAQARQGLQVVKQVSAGIIDGHHGKSYVPVLMIECFGHLRVYAHGRYIRPRIWSQTDGGRAGTHKVREVFAFLVHCGRRGATREQLGSAIWGGEVSRSSLSRTLSTLKQVMAAMVGSDRAGDILVMSRDHYLLAPDSYATDTHMFEHSFRAAERIEEDEGLHAAVPFYLRAVQIYSGSYMADVNSEWSEAQRHWLLNSYLLAAERVAEHSYDNRCYHQCVAVCRQALAADATAAELYEWLFRAYAKLRSFADAEHMYRRYLQEVELDPHSTEAAHDQVVRQYNRLLRK